MKLSEISTVAFYLPQYHPVHFNDVNWNSGFTDWLNVVRAQPQFPGHFQPRLPGQLGFYDLRLHEVMIEQAQLARSYGITAFCFYHYRFNAKRILYRPVATFLANRQPDIPFMLCWANESWTKAWDGRSNECLLAQTYDDTTLQGLIADVTVAVRDDRYFRVGGKPLFLIYQCDLLPEGEAWVGRLKDGIRSKLGEELLVGAVYSPGFKSEMLNWIDCILQFPPHRIPRAYSRKLMSPHNIDLYHPEREDYFENYSDIVQAALEGADIFPSMYLGVTPDWDNSPRRPHHAHIVIGSSPDAFCNWVTTAGRMTLENWKTGKLTAPLLFVNAWNEWAEGAMLEPSLVHGTAYLEALRTGLRKAAEEVAITEP